MSSRSIPAVDVKQNASPAKHDVAMVDKPPAIGKLSRRPMEGDGNCKKRQAGPRCLLLGRVTCFMLKLKFSAMQGLQTKIRGPGKLPNKVRHYLATAAKIFVAPGRGNR